VANIVSIAIAARSTAAAAFNQARAHTRALGNDVRSLTRSMLAQSYQVSSVAGAYRDANGQWRNANGTLLTQRHTVRSVTTSYGHLVNQIQQARRAVISLIIANAALNRVSDNLGGQMRGVALQAGVMGMKLAAVLAVALPLIGVIGNLLGAVQLIAPAAIAGGVALVTWKMALNGVKEALDAGLSGDVKEFEKALQKLAPAAQETVKKLLALRQEWVGLQKAVQQRFFGGAADDLDMVSRAVKPLADRWLPKIANAFARVRHELAFVIAESAKSGQMEKIFAGVERAISGIISMIPAFTQAFLDVAEVAAGPLGDMGDSAAGLADKFAKWIRTMKESGKLKEWLDEALSTLNKLKEIGGNLIGIFQGLFTGSEESGQSFLDMVIAQTEAMEKWVKSADGQKFIEFFAGLMSAISSTEVVWKALFAQIESSTLIITTVVELFKNAWNTAKVIVLGVLLAIISQLRNLLIAAEFAFGWIPGLGPKLTAARAAFDRFAAGVNAALDGILDETVNITYRAIRIGNHTISGAQASGSYSSGIGGRASGGIATGLRWVGERGRELVDFAAGRVYNNEQSERMAARGVGGNQPVHPANFVGFVGVGAAAAIAEIFNRLLRNGDIQMRVDRSGQVRVAGLAGR
jgi:hypothetical protein